jgi:hypothetical protein
MVKSRREFLGDIGRGMLLAGLGTTLASELGLARAWADDEIQPLNFGNLEPLVALMQDTEPAKLTAILVDKLNSGIDLQTLTAAGALANARTFGGQDYVGFHTFMALAPAYRMAQSLPTGEQPLPVLKVLYRNANRIQEFGGRASEVLHDLHAAEIPAEVVKNGSGGEYLREASRKGDIDAADRTFLGLAKGPIGEAYNHLQFAVEDEVDVHRVVLAWRAWDTRELAGEQWGQTLLRQSIRYCANTEARMIERGHNRSPIRELLPKLLDQHGLLNKTLGSEAGDDAWLQELANVVYGASREQAADAVAQALAAGYSAESVGEAISLAANMLVLHDPGRPQEWSNADKPAGSCHGDSVGVHASDAANAWRSIARVSSPRNVVASLIVGAFHTAGQSGRSNPDPYPLAEHLAAVKGADAAALLKEADEAIRAKDQFRSAAVIARYGQLGHDPQAAFDLLLRFATSEDGALHAEKYYQTAVSEYATMRPAFRWGQAVALARVSASEFGYRSAGYEEAKRLLKV